MSAPTSTVNRVPRPLVSWSAPRRVAVVRALLALGWAAGLVASIGDRVPSIHSDVPTAAAVLLATYPLIDVVASVASAVARAGRSAGALFVNAAISALAAAAIAATAFGSDAGAVLVAFGAWATVSGALQFGRAVRDRRAEGGQGPLLFSGGLSTLAGINFLASSRMDNPRLAAIGGYMAVGAVLFLLSARSGRSTARPPR